MQRSNRRHHVRCVAIAVTFAVGLIVRLGAQSAAPAAPPHITAGRNVNIAGGTQALTVNPFFVRGDVLGRAQNEPSCAISTRNPQHILCGANDYRMVDVPGVTVTQLIRDAWLGVFQTTNGGDTWESTLLGGFYRSDNYRDPTPNPLSDRKFIAGADAVVRSGPAGMAFYTGIAFSENRATSALHVTTFADLNNLENDPMPFKAVGTTIVQQVASPKFIDKPWMFVEAASQSGLTCNIRTNVMVNGVSKLISQDVPASVIHIVYTIFQDGTDTTADIMYTKSENCGVNFTTPLRLTSISQKKLDANDDHSENGATIAKALATGSNRIYAAWRRLEKKDAAGNVIEQNAIMISYSNNNGGSWSKPAVLTTICPFDQGTTSTSFRTTVFPTMTVDATGRVYVAWADRGKLANGLCKTDSTGKPDGPARITVATSTDGVTWTQPFAAVPSSGAEHQIQPSLVFTAGRLFLAWMDFKCDASQVFKQYVNEAEAAKQIPTNPPSNDPACTPPFVALTGPAKALRHTGDIRAATGLPAAVPNFAGDTTTVSEYLKGIVPGTNGKVQLGWNAVNRRWARKNTVPFMGDYLDIATMPYLPPDPDRGRKSWVPNNQAALSTSLGTVPVMANVLIAWTDNRDMRNGSGVDTLDADGNPTAPVPYLTPAGFDGKSLFDPTPNVFRNACTVGGDAYKTGTTNQNVYAARATAGWVAGSPGNNKGLGTIQRAFVVFIRNDDLHAAKTFKLVAFQPTGGVASFDQFNASKTTLDVVVPRKSSTSRTVFVSQKPNSSAKLDRDAVVRVDVVETVGGTPVQVVPVYLNSDPSAPEIDSPEIDSPEIDSSEVYTPEIDSPEIDSTSIKSPEIDSPEIDSPEIDSQALRTLGLQSPEIDSQEITSPEIDSPEIDSPEIDSAAIRDVTFKVTNTGNTTAQYGTKAFVSRSARKGDINYQVIVRQKYTVAAVDSDCKPTTLTLSKVLVNQLNVKLSTPEIDSPEIDSPEIDSSAFYVPPSESVDIVIRAHGTETALDALDAKSFDLAVQQEAVNTQDAAAGITEPPIITTFLSVTTTALPTGATGTPYRFMLGYSGGAAGPVTWTFFPEGALPPGLTLGPDGLISGTPTAAGTFPFTVRVRDSDGTTADRDLAIVVTTPGTTSLFFVTQPSDTNISEIMTPAVSVRALDATGAPLPGVAVTVALVGTGTLSGTLTRSTGVTGVAVFDNLSITTAGLVSGLRLRATATSFTAATSVPFGTTRPDLIVESLTHTPSNPTSSDGSITAIAVVTNVGSGSAGASRLMLQLPGETAGAPATLIDVPVLMPGSSFTAQRTLATPVVGSYTHTAIADYSAQVTESNEGNNTTTDTYTVSGAFIVINTNDSGVGSLRQAMLNANAAPGGTTPEIFFAIPGTAPFTINLLSGLPTMTRAVVIDGSTQSGWAGTPVVGINGTAAGTGVNGIHLAGGSSIVRGLQIGGFNGHGILIDGLGFNRIEGNFIGTNLAGAAAAANHGDGILVNNVPGNNIGSPGWGNLVSGNGSPGLGNGGVVISGAMATGNVVQANFIGTNAAGTAAIPNLNSGVAVSLGSGNTVGGSPSGRNIVSGNQIGVALFSATGNAIRSNYVGTTANGLQAVPNNLGILVGASGNTIGGTSSGDRNVVSGNFGGMSVQGSNNIVIGNFVGLSADGLTALGNTSTGIGVNGNSNAIGGTSVGTGNFITANSGVGVLVQGGTGNRIQGNAIYDNGGLGIDLGADGVTPNDAGDGDTGANNLQNFPVITNATATQVTGTLNSIPNTRFTVSLFTGAACDPSGFGELGGGVGTAVVITDDTGFAAFSITPAASGGAFTLTATNETTGDTSEFSQCIVVTTPTSLTFQQQPSGGGATEVGQAIAPAVQVKALDASGATLAGVPVMLRAFPGYAGDAQAGLQQSGIAVDAGGGRVFVTNYGSNTLTVLDVATNAVLADVPVDLRPLAVAVHPTTGRIYVVHWGTAFSSGPLYMIDGSTFATIASVNAGFSASAIAVDPTTNLLWVGHADMGNIDIFDATTLAYVSTLATGWITDIAINQATHRVYAAVAQQGLRVFDAATQAAVASIPFSNPGGGYIAVNESSNRIYVTDGVSDNFKLHVINGDTNTEIASIDTAHGPTGVDIDPAANLVYVGSGVDPVVFILDGTSNTVLSTIASESPGRIKLVGSLNRLYVLNRGGFTSHLPTFHVPPLSGTAFTVPTDSSGVATFSNVAIADFGHGYQLRASSGAASTVSAPFDVVHSAALEFDGVDDFVDIPQSTSLNLSTLTLEAWIKIDGPAFFRMPVISKGADFGNYTLSVLGNQSQATPGSVEFVQRTPAGSFSCAGSAVTFGQWQHIAATESGGIVTVYVNGTPLSTCSGAPAPLTNSEDLFLGRAAFGDSFDQRFLGDVDEVRVWNVARTGAEIATDYNRRLPAGTPGLVSYWSFDEATLEQTVLDWAGSNGGTLGVSGAVDSADPERVVGID